MTVAVLSGTGFLGSAVARQLAASRVPVVCISRGMTGAVPPAPIRFARADRMDVPSLRGVLHAFAVTAVIDILPLSVRNAAPAITATRQAGARYVMISSVDVYANYDGLLRKTQPDIRMTPATEGSLLREGRFPYRGNPNRPKGVSAELFEDYDKQPVEEMLRADPDLRHAILRPPMIFGPGDKQRRFGWAIDAARSGGPVRLDARASGWLNSYAFVDDVAAAAALLATHPAAEGRTFNVAYPEASTQRRWLEAILRRMSCEVEIEETPPEAAGVLSDRAEAMDLRYPLTLDSGLIRRDLSYSETMPVDEALDRAIASDPAGQPPP